MFYTVTFAADGRILEDHASLADAEAFAREVAAEGCACALLRTLDTVTAELPGETWETRHGLMAGKDFPGSLGRGDGTCEITHERKEGSKKAGYLLQ